MCSNKFAMFNVKLTIVWLFAICCFALKDSKMAKCVSSGGECVSEASVTNECTKLRHKCNTDEICCRTTKYKIRKGGDKVNAAGSQTRRKCKKTSKKCSKEGGTCLASANNNCEVGTVDSLCKGASCTCCLGEASSCGKSLPGCRFKGGVCMRSKLSSSCQGSLNKTLCSSKSCSCCLANRKCKCGLANTGRIIGGADVPVKNMYPWLVALSSYLFSSYFCGASIINNLYVLTAAHCLYDFFKMKPLKVKAIEVALADYNQFSTIDDVPGVTRKVPIKNFTIHQNYSPLGLDEDIAIIKLKEPLDLSVYKQIQPVCLPLNSAKTYEGSEAVVAGWGRMNYSDSSSIPGVLQQLAVSIQSPQCISGYPASVNFTKNMLCAKSNEGTSVCYGDSGGPLVVKEGTIYTLVGLVSFVYGCGFNNTPAVYTRVTRYLDWIIDQTGDANYCS